MRVDAAVTAVVVMGVSGCGKSAVAAGIAQRLGLRAVDADDLHTPEAVARMRAGIALTDEDRWPWLDRVGAVLAAALPAAPTEATGADAAPPAGTVVACSALKRAYRQRLRATCPGLRFVFLDGDPALIAQRLQQRSGHYMPASLLLSQLQTLERPGADEPDVLRLDLALPLAEVVDRACAGLVQPETPGATPAASPVGR